MAKTGSFNQPENPGEMDVIYVIFFGRRLGEVFEVFEGDVFDVISGVFVPWL